MTDRPDYWQSVFLISAAALVLLQAWVGWRRGIVRQALTLAAIAAGYVVAILGGHLLVPLLRPFGFPDQLLALMGGAVLGLAAFLIISVASAILFKKTSQQSVGVFRFGYGAAGALLGAVFGLFLVWVAVVAIRLLGTVAETEVLASERPVGGARRARVQLPREPSPLVRGLASMKQSMEHGAAGAVMEQVDPLPAYVYEVLGKVTQVVAQEDRMKRFLEYPGVQPLARHPKIVALQHDPAIEREVLSRDYYALIRNEKIVQVANDPELAVALRELEFLKALDYALAEPPPGAAGRQR